MSKFSITITKTFAKSIKSTEIIWNDEDKELASFTDELAAGHLFEKFTGKNPWAYGRTIKIIPADKKSNELLFWINNKEGITVAFGSFERDGSLFYSSNSLRIDGYATVYRDGNVLGVVQYAYKGGHLSVYGRYGNLLSGSYDKPGFLSYQRWLEQLFPINTVENASICHEEAQGSVSSSKEVQSKPEHREATVEPVIKELSISVAMMNENELNQHILRLQDEFNICVSYLKKLKGEAK